MQTTEEDLLVIIREHGDEQQSIVAMEELAELTQAISKQLRGEGDRENLIEEIADVYIVLWELRLMNTISDEIIHKKMDEKVMRTLIRTFEEKQRKTNHEERQ